MPTEQMATAVFMDQTRLGWDAFFFAVKLVSYGEKCYYTVV